MNRLPKPVRMRTASGGRRPSPVRLVWKRSDLVTYTTRNFPKPFLLRLARLADANHTTVEATLVAAVGFGLPLVEHAWIVRDSQSPSPD